MIDVQGSLSTLITFFKIQLSQNVIDSKDQMAFKVLLANRWSPSSDMGSYTSTKEREKYLELERGKEKR